MWPEWTITAYGADVRRAVRGIPRDAATVLLAHNPRIISLAFPARCEPGPVRAYPRRPSEPAAAGNRLRPLPRSVCGTRLGGTAWGTTQIYVSRGIGTIVLPWRLRWPGREITSLELLPGTFEASQPSVR